MIFDDAGAIFSPDRTYRYSLFRRWGTGPAVNFIMLNPSTADQNVLDPTVRRCVGYARSWGYEALVVTNLFALRSTDPHELYRHPEPIGPDNDGTLHAVAYASSLVLCAWGNHGTHLDRAQHVTDLLTGAGVALRCLKTTSTGQPGHPLYLPKSLQPAAYASRRSEPGMAESARAARPS